MVTQKWILTLLGIAAVMPVRADGILEQIQNEVAKITMQTRSAVVAVEDERKKITFEFFASPATPVESQTTRLQALQMQKAKFEALIVEQDKKLMQYRKAYETKRSKEALEQLDMVTTSRRELSRHRTMLKSEMDVLEQLSRRQVVATLENSVMTEQFNALVKDLTDSERELRGSEAEHDQ